MKTKEEVIKEAYGEHWETVKNYLNKDGWAIQIEYRDIQEIKNMPCLNDMGIYQKDNLVDFMYDSEKYQHLWRPKSLQGIENNNGWVKIESEDDLPKDEENLDYWVMEDEQIVHAKFMPESKRWYCDIDLNLRLFPSHYQPMVKPKPPIY